MSMVGDIMAAVIAEIRALSNLQMPPATQHIPSGQQPVDYAAALDALAQSQPGTDWRTSLTDLLALLSVDNSVASCQQLATELNYSGDINDASTMNPWLLQQLLLLMVYPYIPADAVNQ